MVERTVPGAGDLSGGELRELSAKSNEVLAGMGDEVRWIESYVTPDKLYCVYEATDPERIEEHARRGGFPCDRVSPVRTVIDPGTAS
ncbi:DUF4242 domain-containing protein [Salinifilum ghardaiensis]